MREQHLATGLTCTECGNELEPVTDGWIFKDEVLCQMCWEDYASRTWWEELRKVKYYVWARDFVPPLHPAMARALNAAAGNPVAVR